MRHDSPLLVPQDAAPGQPGRASTRERGFILIVVVGMLAVLVVLGLSYAEQGRVELRGASNTRDLAALDGLSESGFQLALRALRDDRNVKHASSTPAHLTLMGGIGWTSRWGYNPDPTLNGAMPTGADKAPSRSDAYNFQDSWRMLLWNEETVEPVASWTGTAWGYGFKFRPGTDDEAKRSMETQRFPQPSSVLLDTVQLQPFARSRKFRVQVGSSFGLIQVGISPKDGGVMLNDVFDPATVDEKPGIYETLPSGVAPNTRTWQEGTKDLAGYDVTADATKMAKVPYASPDRRTLEYILGRAPQFAAKNRETSVYYRYRATSLRLMLSGSAAVDNGLYNWRYAMEPYGGQRATTHAGGPAALWKYDYTYSGGYKLRASTAVMTSATSGAPTTIWNMAAGEPNRFGLESSRHIMWAALKGMAYTADGIYQKPGIGFLVAPGHYGSSDSKDYLWYPTGLWTSDPRLPSADAQMVDGYKKEGDNMFHGFGFDRFNAPRAGIDGSSSAYWNGFYYGPGGYGHPKARTFQLHYINAVANGRFWTDLLAAWYFGGAPGYTNFLGASQSSGYNNWAHLGSSYDSIGIGTHWMPPTSHVWMPGFFNKGRISTPTEYTTQGGGGISSKAGKDELSRGMTRWPGNMPPVRMAASYLVPMARWPADFVGQSNAQFCYNNFRLSIRAHGLQENWGDPNAPGTVNGTAAQNRWYDAIDINNSNFPVIYGLLSPEKIPSLLARTMVAPHLHWKSRMLDAEVRLRQPVKIDGTANAYNDVTNSWIPVALALRTTDTGKTYPGGDWDGDPDSGSYNPWVPLRMKLNDPTKPWHPTDNIWIEPRLRDKNKPFDPVSNPLYNTAAFLNELSSDANVRNDYIKYPWMPSLKKPVEINGATGTPTIDPGTNEAIIRYGLYKFDDATLIAQADWSTWIQDTGLPENFPYMPIDSYGANPTWHGPGPFDGGGAPYPSPGWDGYCFEPRWYTGRTVNPKYLKDKLVLPAHGGAATTATIGEVAAYLTRPGYDNGAIASTLQSDPATEPTNAWDFSAHATDIKLSGGIGALSYHRHIDPAAGRRNVIWGKMDFLTPEPKEYYDLNGDVVGYGTGRPQDDVFLDTHLDLSLQEMALTDTDQTYASAMARPDSFRNAPEWFSQRKRAISADSAGVDRTQAPFRPMTNDVNVTLYWRNKDPNWGWTADLVKDGKVFENTDSSGTNQFDPAISSLPGQQRTRKVRGTTQNRGYWWDWGGSPEPDVKPHSAHGLPNPDYLCLYPGGPASQHWVDQFRRYFPLQLEEIPTAGDPYDDPDNDPATMNNNPFPGAMPYRFKMVDDPDLAGNAAAHTAVNPAIPVPRNTTGDDTTPHVPAISKDEGWRVTRGGPRYNEIIANEIMDYQLNPWWPNPCVPVSEVCAPLDKVTYPSEPRAKVKVETLTGRNAWRSYAEHMSGNEATIGARVPKYYAYFNRFWARTNHKAVRNWAGDPNAFSRPLGEPYRAITIPGNAAAGIPEELINADEGKGMFPPTWQYFGQYPPKEPTFQDRIKDFPYNAMEDQLGDDWRYLAKAAAIMTEPQMQKATGRNHPFRNWADFVAMLGHLVYRTPLDPKATPELANANPKATRDVLDGVNAWTVCHGADADPRNIDNFFDGSKISSGGTVYADSLRSPIVAKAGWWPIAANYGRAPDASGDAYYPNTPGSGGWGATEWKRRWDEIRGRDEAGMRVEQHYISEKAANDVLVSLSNGRIGPIDFDGDGHVTMTRGYGKDITPGYPYGTTAGNINEMANAKPSGDLVQQRTWDGHSGYHHWPQWALPYGYPWHTLSTVDPASVVEFEEYDDEPTYDTSFANRDFWDTDSNAKTMSPLNLKIGIVPQAHANLWRKADKRDLILNSVTLPIKFHSNTFRITVVVELTDAKYEEIYASRRYQKVVSRVPDTSVTNVHGPFTGEFIEHSSRAMNGVDPELNWLGVK